MRRMSFALTTDAVLNRTKTVTRRIGWTFAKVGDRYLAVDKLRTTNAKKLGVIEVVSVRREFLYDMHEDDVVLEGMDTFERCDTRESGPHHEFPSSTCTDCFYDMFVAANDRDGHPSDGRVTRIEFRYVEPWEIRCTTTWPKGGGLKGRFQCGLMEDHDGDHSALIPSNAPWSGLKRKAVAND